MITILAIRLKNWFNYQGEFDDNELLFKSGLNFFVADNGNGKTKLHNALRWILTGEIIVNSQLTSIDSKVATGFVVSRDYYKRLNAREEYEFGVQVDYAHGDNKYRVSMTWKGNKDENNGRVIQKVLRPGAGNAWINANQENFEERRQIIARTFMPFLFLEGEQLNNLIPFSGEQLKSTIDKITNISTIDKIAERARMIKGILESKKDEETLRLNQNNQELRAAISSRERLSENEERLQRDISIKTSHLEQRIGHKEELVQLANNQQAKQKAVKGLEVLNGVIIKKKQAFESREAEYFQCISKNFGFTLYLNPQEHIEYLNTSYRSIIEELIARRKAELDQEIDPHKQYMLSRLIRNQPGVEILEEILEYNRCFVCGHGELTDDSREYIRNHLIPQFNGDADGDDATLKLFQSTNQLLNKCYNVLATLTPPEGIFDDALREIGNAQQELNDAEVRKKQHINDHAMDLQNEANTGDVLRQFENILSDIRNTETELKQLHSELKDTQNQILACRTRERQLNGGHDGANGMLESALEFQSILLSKLDAEKTKIYTDFCIELGDAATERLHSFFGQRLGVQSKFDVSLSQNDLGLFSFAISVKDQAGTILAEPGGAETSIRQYCVVLALIQLSKARGSQICRFPLIIDAPMSRANTGYRLPFYRGLFNEKGNHQIIVMTYDLCTEADLDKNPPEPSRINQAGVEVHNLLQHQDNNQKSGNFIFKQFQNEAAELITDENINNFTEAL